MSVLVKAAELKRLCPTARADVLDGLARAAGPILAKYDINTSLRLQHFMAQIAHESAGFRYLREVWGPTPAQTRYEGRKDLGNTQPGDGFRFRGRGFLQVTGRANYRRIGAAMGLDLEAHPEKLEEPAVALESACIYWRDHRLNALADKDDLRAITLRVNGGLNGYDSRGGYLKRAKSIWKTLAVDPGHPAPPAMSKPSAEPAATPPSAASSRKGKPMALFSWVAARLAEPSTWVGAATVASAVAKGISTKDWGGLVTLALGAAGMAMTEKGAKR